MKIPPKTAAAVLAQILVAIFCDVDVTVLIPRLTVHLPREMNLTWKAAEKK